MDGMNTPLESPIGPMQVTPTYSFAAVSAATATVGVSSFTAMVMPPVPEPGLHPMHEFHHGDPLAGLMFGFAVAALYPTTGVIIGSIRRRKIDTVDRRKIL